MILQSISLLDCLVFVILLTPQLIIQVGMRTTALAALQMLPFLTISLPYQLIKHDILTAPSSRPPFHAQAPLFTSLVIRCVRHAFAHLPAKVGAVFFSKAVALPFAQWRMFRHGIWPMPYQANSSTSPSQQFRSFWARVGPFVGFKRPECYWEEKMLASGLKGTWIIRDPSAPPDAIVYYIHGGGFSMGSPWFYFEFLLGLLDLVSPSTGKINSEGEKRPKSFANPAAFAIDYTLVPTATFPTQLQQILQGYDYVRSLLSRNNGTDAPPIELAGDSAGATLALSLLLLLASDPSAMPMKSFNGTTSEVRQRKRPLPAHTTLVSPWCRLISQANSDTPSDYLNGPSLHLYARQYVGEVSANIEGESREDALSARSSNRTANPLASPAECTDNDTWRRACPPQGIHFMHGSEEVFAPEAKALAERIKKASQGVCEVVVTEEPRQIHAWPVVNLFLGSSRPERLKGLRLMANEVLECML